MTVSGSRRVPGLWFLRIGPRIWRFTCLPGDVAETCSSPHGNPVDELKDIGKVLEWAKSETTHVQSEIETILDELRSITGRGPHPKAA